MKLGSIQVKVIIVAITISIAIDPLKRICRIEVAFVRPTVTINIRATKSIFNQNSRNY